MKNCITKPIAGFGGQYSVSDDGRVFSRKGEMTVSAVKGRSHTYCRVYLYCPEKRKSCTKYVHVLVLEAFVGPRPEGCESAHWDGNGTNNHLSNLRWASRQDNCSDKVRHGRDNRGVRSVTHVLSEKDVKRIVALLESGINCYKIAKRFGVSCGTIGCIKNGRTWKHLDVVKNLDRSKLARNKFSIPPGWLSPADVESHARQAQIRALEWADRQEVWSGNHYSILADKLSTLQSGGPLL